MSHIARSSLIVAVFFGFDKVFGFIRTILVNRQFGLGYDLDVFNAANNIPDLLSALISGGALGVALIPVLSEYMQKEGRQSAWFIFSNIINFAFLITAIIAIIVALIAPWLVSNIIVPGFPEEQKLLTIDLLRLDLLAILVFSISGLVMAGLHANQHFILPALAPGLYNFGQIFGVVILAPVEAYHLGGIALPAMGLGIHGLVYGVIIGAVLHLAIQIPGLIRYKYRWKFGFKFKDAGVQKIFSLLGPRILTMFFIQLFFIVRDNLASGLGEGAVTALNNGWFLMQVPETLFGTAVAIALLPTISEAITRGDYDGFKKTVNRAGRTILALTIPSAVLIAIGVRPLIQAAFGFDLADTEMIVLATRIYLLGLSGHALLEIAARSFYAQQNAVTPLFAAALNAIGYILLANFLANTMGFSGIALANSIVFTTEAALLLWLLNKKFPGLSKFGKTILRVLLASTGSGLGVFLFLRIGLFNQLSPIQNAIFTLLTLGVGFLIIMPFIWPEIKLLMKLEKSPAAPPLNS